MGDPMTLLALSLATTGIFSDGQRDTLPSATGAPTVHAVRVESGGILLDGVLTEAGWSTASPVSDFTQREPDEGAAATERTEVRVLYDDNAVYVGARLYDQHPDSVLAQLARRDRVASADRFLVFLDSYYDRRTGFFFGINAAGTLYDGTLYNDDWDSDTWDGVWEGKAVRDSLGWTAEMRIPYSQLRFQRQTSQRWGINFKREIARRNERDYLVRTPSNGSGFVSRFVRPGWHRGRSPRRPARSPPLRDHPSRILSHESADPFNDGSRRGRGPRRRSQARHRQQPDAGRHGEPRLRPGRGGPRGRQPERRRDLLRRAAAVLRRGGQHLRVRLRRRQRFLGLQLGQSQISSTAGGSGAAPQAELPDDMRLFQRAQRQQHPRSGQAVGQGGRAGASEH